MKRTKSWDKAPSYDGGSVRAGLLETAIYEDGTPVAQVGFWNEYGTRNIPPRPFMRSVIEQDGQQWAQYLGKLIKTEDTGKALNVVGAEMAGAITGSILQFTTPPNAPSTIRKKGFNKPLIDTGVMSRSVSWEVQDES